jgi:hypothetical protein
MYSNVADLEILDKMGVRVDNVKQNKKPSLRAVVSVVIGAIRMQKMQQRWAVQKRVQKDIIRKKEQIKGMRTSSSTVYR